MKRRIIKLGLDARDRLAKGADFLADAVGSTLGPFGQTFFLDKKNTITNDGVTVAREIQLLDEVANRGVAAMREAAIKTVDEAGDGTTTATILARAIYKSASKLLSKEGVIGKMTPAQVIQKIEAERKEVTEKLTDLATPIETEEQLVKSAIVSTGDQELGTLIGKAQFSLGKDGYLLAEPSNDKTLSVEHIKGVRWDNGLGTSGIVNNPEKWQLEVEDTAILLTTITFKDTQQWLELKARVLDPAWKSGVKTLTIIARAWTDETLSICLKNLNEGAFKIYPLNAPYLDMTQKMKDLAAVTGATFYDSDSSDIDSMMVSGLGFAKKVIAKRMESLLIGKDDEKTGDRVAQRVDELQKQYEGSESEFEKKLLRERIAQLTDGFAIVKIGSPSDMERQRLFDKAEDAVNAVRVAFQEGTVPGAGLALKTIADTLPDDYILKRPLMSPYEQIISSAPPDFVIEDWVRDPLKVIRVALQNACTAASSFANVAGVITEEFPKPLNELIKPVNSDTQE